MDESTVSDKADSTRSLEEVEEFLTELYESEPENYYETQISLEGDKLYVKTKDEFIKEVVRAFHNTDTFTKGNVTGRFPPMEPVNGEMVTIMKE